MNFKAIIYTLLIVIFCYSVTENAKTQGDPAARLKGLKQTLYSLGASIFAPNNQMTKTSGISTLIETGNTNLLANPSFEHATYDTSWAYTGDATKSLETSIVIDGNKSVKIVAAGNGYNHSQVSTLYAAQLAGVQGVASVWVKSDNPSDTVCAVVDSVDVDCVTLNADNQWREVVIPFVMGGTNNGIVVKAGTSAGTTYIDNAFVGVMPATMMPEVSQAQIAGESYWAGTASCQWTRTSTTIGAFGTDADCPGPTIVHQNIGQWQTTDSDLPRQTINNLPAGQYKAKFIYPNFAGASVNTAYAINDGTTTCEAVVGSTNTVSMGSIVECTFNYTSTGNRVFEIFGASSSNSVNIINTVASNPRASTKFILEYYPPKSKIYSQQVSYIDWTPYTPTTPNSSFAATASGITVGANDCRYRRNRDALDIVCKFQAGVVQAQEARISLPTGLTIAGTDKVGSIQQVGTASTTQQNQFNSVLIEPSVTYVTFGRYVYGGGVSPINKANANTFIASSDTVMFTAFGIPIEEWKNNSNVITGTFKNVVTAPNVAKPKTCSAKISATGVISDHFGNCFASCTNATTPVCTFNTNYWASGIVPNCWHSTSQASTTGEHSVSATQFSGIIYNTSDVAISGARTYFCQGAGQ